MTKRTVGDVSAAQIVGMFGPGSIINLETTSVMPESPSSWPLQRKAISSPTFAGQIGARELIDCGSLSGSYIPSRLFPSVFVCRSCGKLERVTQATKKQLDTGVRCPSGHGRMHPSRWVVFCPRGHIDDFDYAAFVHGSKSFDCDQKGVTLMAAATVAETMVSCAACGAKRSLQEGYPWAKTRRCRGRRPWERGPNEECDAVPKLSMRSASDVYFGAVRSAISIEPESKHSVRVIFELLSDSSVSSAQEAPDYLKFKPQASAFTQEDLSFAIDAYFRAKEDPGSYEDRRSQEYASLTKEMGGPNEDLWVAEVPNSGLAFAGISNVMAVRRLREVRALYGFQRGSMPVDPTFEQSASRELSVRFRDALPAYENRGEGIFFNFNSEALREWLGRPEVGQSISRFERAEGRWIADTSRGSTQTRRGLYILAHSFAHLVIGQLALECGYSQAALRERIFASTDDAERPWAGVLIYTSSSDADGSLGGLVFQALDRRIPAIVARGYGELQICSSDPICALQEPKGFRKLNGAACHSCLVLPETSCERNNTFLDRNTVVPGTLRDPVNALYFGTVR